MTYQQTIMEERLFAREEGLKEGMKEGLKEGAFSILAELVHDNILPISIAAQRTGLTENDFKVKMEEILHKK